MNEVKDRAGFLREGLFAKYVVALVGLVVFVLAVNGAIEIWITYRGIKSSLNDGMSEKAEATAKRIQQSLSDLERQISWVTRASSNTTDLRRADYAQLLRQVPQVSQLSLLNAQGREQLRMTRQTVTLGQQRGFLPRRQADRNRLARHQFCAGLFPRRAAVHVDRAVACRRQHHHRRDRPRLPVGVLDRCPGRQGGVCLCHRCQGRRAGRLLDRARGRQESVEAAAGRRPSAGPAAWRRHRAPIPRATPC